MCLLREILFTGINAFYTQASVGTLSRGLEPAGTCAAGLIRPPGARLTLAGAGGPQISNVVGNRSLSPNQDVPDAGLRMSAQLLQRRETRAAPGAEGGEGGVRILAGCTTGWIGASLL